MKEPIAHQITKNSKIPKKQRKIIYVLEKNFNKKESQGRKKLTQYIEDLKRNAQFRKDFKKLCHVPINNKTFGEEAIKLMERYKITYGTLECLDYYIDDKETFNWGTVVPDKLMYDNHDMCTIMNALELRYGNKYSKINKQYWNENIDSEFIIASYLLSYPISINIHKFASKRDVLDFIERNWPIINNFLKPYRTKPKRIRKRKIDRKIIDFIWENRELSAKQILKKLDKEFPNHGLVYYEIKKIIRVEKSRRIKHIP